MYPSTRSASVTVGSSRLAVADRARYRTGALRTHVDGPGPVDGDDAPASRPDLHHVHHRGAYEVPAVHPEAVGDLRLPSRTTHTFAVVPPMSKEMTSG